MAGQVEIKAGQVEIKAMMANTLHRNYNALSSFQDHELEVGVGVCLVGRRCCVARLVSGVYPCLFVVAGSRCASSAWVARSAAVMFCICPPHTPRDLQPQSTTCVAFSPCVASTPQFSPFTFVSSPVKLALTACRGP